MHVGEDTTLSHIIKIVSDAAAATKAPVAKIADKVSGVFVPAVIVITAITTIIWLATPVAIMIGNGVEGYIVMIR